MESSSVKPHAFRTAVTEIVIGLFTWLGIAIFASILIYPIRANASSGQGCLSVLFVATFGVTQGIIGGIFALKYLTSPDRQFRGLGILFGAMAFFVIYYGIIMKMQ
jgi:hypothetical protein